MKRNAFTMIELVFVIVILGILAAVAIPKIMATKDDAQIVKEVSNAKQLIQNAGAEYTAQGEYTASNYPDTKCFSFTPSNDGNFTVTRINSTTDLCTKLTQSGLGADLNKTYQFGGHKVKW